MKLNEYQAKAAEFAVYSSLDYPLLALGEEVGELQGKVAKYVRKNGCSADLALIDASPNPAINGGEAAKLHDDLISEAGDVLWNPTNLLNDLGVSLEDCAKANIDKLESRKQRDVIVGEGDDR